MTQRLCPDRDDIVEAKEVKDKSMPPFPVHLSRQDSRRSHH